MSRVYFRKPFEVLNVQTELSHSCWTSFTVWMLMMKLAGGQEYHSGATEDAINLETRSFVNFSELGKASREEEDLPV